MLLLSPKMETLVMVTAAKLQLSMLTEGGECAADMVLVVAHPV